MRQNTNYTGTTPQAGFTLAELLAVLLIIGIMLIVGLPAFMNLTNSSKLDAAANTVHSALKMARQHALTHNQPTYLVFHDDETAVEADRHMAYRAFSVFTIDLSTSPVTQDSGLFLNDWQTLPEGLVFEAAVSENLNNVFLVGHAGQWAGGFNRNRQLYIGTNTYTALGFKPGGTQRMDFENDIYLAEGFYDESGNVIHTSRQGKRIRVDGTGRSQISSITFTESGELAE